MSLIHWWQLNGDTKDYGINNLNGTLIGSTSFDNSGKIGKCLLADTGSLYSGRGVDIPSNLVSELSDKDYSFAAWVKPNGNHVHYEGAIISSGNWNNKCWAFGLNSSNTAINPAGNWYNNAYVSYTFTIGQWYHIVSVQKNGTNYVYVNGSLVGTVSHSPISQSDASDTCIGRETYASGYFGFNGCINDVRIYDHALSAKEVKEISKGLVLHYTLEDPYIEGTTNLSSYSNIGGWNNSGAASYNQNDTSISNIPCPNCKVLSITQTTAGQSAGTFGTTSSNVPSKTLTASVWFYMSGTHTGSSNIGPYIRSNKTDGNIGTLEYNGSTDFRNFPNNTWIKLTKTFTTNSEATTVYFCCYTANAGEKFAFNGWQIEEKDHATPYVNGTRNPGLLYDSSGYGRNAISINNPQIVEDSGSGKYSARLLDSTNGYFDLGIKTLNFLTYGTISFWAKYTSSNNKMLFGANDSGGKYFLAWYNGVNWYSSGITIAAAYCDGVERNSPIIDDNWHCYTFTGVNCSSWGDLHYFMCVYANDPTNSFQFHGYLGELKVYATSLTANEVLADYQTKASLDKEGNLYASYLEEYNTTNNLLSISNYATMMQSPMSGYLTCIKKSQYEANYPRQFENYNCIGAYTQAHLSVTVTSQGIRIYSPPNWDGRAISGSGWDTWGGLCLSPMMYSNCLFKGHRYVLSWHVKGQSSASMSEVYFSSQVGWGTGYTNPSTTSNKIITQPENFQGEMDCYWDFTINDDIWKVCVDNQGNTSFVNGETYLSYAAVKLGYGYRETGPLGTDIYITNIKLYDITENKTYKITKTGIMKTTEISSGFRSSARLHSDGEIDVTNVREE